MTDLLGIVKHSYSRDIMFRLLKTDLTPLTREAVDELENYVLEFGIDHLQWERDNWSYMRRVAGAFRRRTTGRTETCARECIETGHHGYFDTLV